MQYCLHAHLHRLHMCAQCRFDFISPNPDPYNLKIQKGHKLIINKRHVNVVVFVDHTVGEHKHRDPKESCLCRS